MTSTYLTNITPDSLSGLIFAFEGIHDTTVLLNGPGGLQILSLCHFRKSVSPKKCLRPFELPGNVVLRPAPGSLYLSG